MVSIHELCRGLKCDNCGKPLNGPVSHRRFCNEKCRKAWHYKEGKLVGRLTREPETSTETLWVLASESEKLGLTAHRVGRTVRLRDRAGNVFDASVVRNLSDFNGSTDTVICWKKDVRKPPGVRVIELRGML